MQTDDFEQYPIKKEDFDDIFLFKKHLNVKYVNNNSKE